MTDIINSLAHRAEIEQAQRARAELHKSRGLEPVCCGMPATCDSCTKPTDGGHVQRMAELIAERDRLRTEVDKWRATLTAIMPADFKDWHQNAPAEWPDIAAWVITNAREQCDAAEGLADIAIAERDALRGRVAELEQRLRNVAKDAS